MLDFWYLYKEQKHIVVIPEHLWRTGSRTLRYTATNV